MRDPFPNRRGKSRLMANVALPAAIQGQEIAAVWIDEADPIQSLLGGGIFLGFIGDAPCDTDPENDSPAANTPEAGR